jgi:hypothetical protein
VAVPMTLLLDHARSLPNPFVLRADPTVSTL